MPRRLLAVSFFFLFLGGCDFLQLMLPHNAATVAEVRRAMQQCGVSPDSLAWRVTEDGAFAFGRKSADAAPIPDRQSDCMMRLGRRPPRDEARLSAKLKQLEQKTGYQLVVVTVSTLNGRDAADFTKELANCWGVGRKGYNDGVVLLVAPNERKVRIAVVGLTTAT